MNAGEVAKFGWQLAGEDSRFDGDDLTTAEGKELLKKLNSAYAVVASHKFPRIGVIPFRGMEAEVVFSSLYSTTTVNDAGATVSSFDLATAVSAGQLLTIVGEHVEVVAVAGTTVTVAPDLPAAPENGTTVVVRSKQYDLATDVGLTMKRVLELQDLYDLTNKQELFVTNNSSFFDSRGTSLGVPCEYVRAGVNKLILDIAPEASYRYRLRYIKLPDELTAASDELVLPEHFHEAIAMRLAFVLKLIQQDYEGAYGLKRHYESELKQLQHEYEQFWNSDLGKVVLV